ncbi:MAG: hypothetical protein RLO52_01015 [Sandaracinaceae bacterium]|nr:MAG: hypothetical protein EVA89_27760 [Sandaracinaceae bacterium]HBQ14930.1 hypothetical protein [Myxococcales bacterium]
MRAWLLCLASLVVACGQDCPTERSRSYGDETYCGEPCAACADCEEGFSCQLRAGRGVCVDEAFLRDRGVSTVCEDPCPSGEARYQGECARICNVDGECDHCCIEPAELEFFICAPSPDSC